MSILVHFLVAILHLQCIQSLAKSACKLSCASPIKPSLLIVNSNRGLLDSDQKAGLCSPASSVLKNFHHHQIFLCLTESIKMHRHLLCWLIKNPYSSISTSVIWWYLLPCFVGLLHVNKWQYVVDSCIFIHFVVHSFVDMVKYMYLFSLPSSKALGEVLSY